MEMREVPGVMEAAGYFRLCCMSELLQPVKCLAFIFTGKLEGARWVMALLEGRKDMFELV